MLIEKLTFRPAQTAELSPIVELVNAAYRGGEGQQGWTTEDYLVGGQRTDQEELSRLIQAEDSIVLLCLLNREIVASVHLEKHEGGAYLGMLAVNPLFQNQGIGKRLMAEAEQIARRQWAAEKMLMTVISLREDVIEFYQRYGYVRTGRTVPFPSSEKFGIQKVPGLLLEYLEKLL